MEGLELSTAKRPEARRGAAMARWAPVARRNTPAEVTGHHDGHLPLFPRSGPDALDAVILSDIHLGSNNCQAKVVLTFLERILAGKIRTARVIINGDVFDSIDFRRLKKTHWKVLSMIRHLSDKMKVIWTCGNHDGPAEIISHLLGVQVRDEFIFTSGRRRILVLHGHIFDDFIDQHPLLTWVGDLIYNLLQRVDRRHYVARLAKSSSKIFLHCAAKIQDQSMQYALRHDCDTVICGHTHHAIAAPLGPVAYFNSGCWTELPPSYLTVRAGAVTLCRYQESGVMASGRLVHAAV